VNPGATARRVLADRLIAERAGEAAEVLETAAPAEAAALVAEQSPAGAARVIERMVPARSAEVLDALPAAAHAAILPLMFSPRAAAALAWLPPERREEIVEAAGSGTARELRGLLVYPPETAGSMMDPRVITLREGDTVGRALERLRTAAGQAYQIYVVDDELSLVGAVPVVGLAISQHDAPLAPLMNRSAPAVPALATREEVVEELMRTGEPSLAVLDADGALIGVLRHRALVGAAEEEAGADIQKMVGVSSEERALSPIRFKVRQRLPWLHINLVTAFIAASVVGLFEGTIAQVTSLAILLPVVAGQAGNAGAQALAVTMRGLALRQIRGSQWRQVVGRELAVAVLNGAAIALVCGAGVLVWSRSVPLALIIAAAMVIAMAAAGLAGASIPLLLRALGQDPAQSSSIILTTVTDVVGFFSFLGLAALAIQHLGD
jgi:magnesium transporter